MKTRVFVEKPSGMARWIRADPVGGIGGPLMASDFVRKKKGNYKIYSIHCEIKHMSIRRYDIFKEGDFKN